MAFIGYIFACLTIASVHAVYQFANIQNNQGFMQPQFPTIAIPTFKPMVFPTFPTFPTFSPEDIINKKVGPGVNFDGFAVSSSSVSGLDKDGNVIRTGGTKIITKKNGVVEEFSYNDPPSSNINIVSSTFPRITPIIPEVTDENLTILEDLIIDNVPFVSIPPIPRIPPIDPIIIQKSKPGYNEHFTGTSFVSIRHQSNINGDRTSGGVDTIIVNDNGKVNKTTYKYGDLNDDLK